MNNFKNFVDDRLPNRRKFYSFLKGECVSDEDYLHAVNVWNIFNMKAVGYHEDVLLLANVFEKFINVCLECYGLDSCYYFSSHGLSWDVMLKICCRIKAYFRL